MVSFCLKKNLDMIPGFTTLVAMQKEPLKKIILPSCIPHTLNLEYNLILGSKDIWMMKFKKKILFYFKFLPVLVI